MELQITGKNMEVTPEVKSYIERKLGKMSKHLSNIIKSNVEVIEEKTKSPQQHFVVQVTVDSNGTLLRGEERGKDAFTAIDKVATVMNRQIEHYKGKMRARDARGALSIRTEPSKPSVGTESEFEPKVVKVKRFAVKPMSVTEATDQMELLGHDFFLFRNSETEELNLIYRRKDKNYGLIEPGVK
jgi:putative sigma-54 modulation protein